MEKSRIIVHLHIAVDAAETFDRHVTKLFSTRPLSGFPCFESLGISNCTCGAHCWQDSADSESGTKTILASDSYSESPRPPWWFFVGGKEPGFLRFSSKHWTPRGVFRKERIVGASCRCSLVLVGQKRDRDETRSSSVAVRDFCSRPIRACLSRTLSSSADWKLFSYGLRQ